MRYIDKIKNVSQLDNLCCDLSERIFQYRDSIERILPSKGLLGKVETSKLISPDEVDRLYNKNISQEDKQAWIYYKQSIGNPMKGWERYINGKTQSESKLVYAVREGVVRNTSHQPVGTFQKGTLIGKYIKTTADGYHVRMENGVVLINPDDVRINKVKTFFSDSKLKELAKAKALFYVDGELLPYPIYAYANMYDRIQQLQKDEDYIKSNYGADVYQYQWEICNKSESAEFPHGAKPPMRSCMATDPKDRMIISPNSDFARNKDKFSISTVRTEYLDIDKSTDKVYQNGVLKLRPNKDKITIKLDAGEKYDLLTVFKKYLFALPQSDFDNSEATYIVQYYLEAKRFVNDKIQYPEEKTAIINYAKMEGDALFQKFLHEVLTPEDQLRLDYTWNRDYNAIAPIKYNKVPIMFSASSLFKGNPLRLKDMQREVLGFFETVGSGIVSLDVGGGKTICMIVSLAMGLQQGKFKRPLLVLSKPVYRQFIREMQGYEYKDDKGKKHFSQGVLTGTDIVINDWGNLGSSYAKTIGDKPKIKENTITVITKEGLEKLGFSDKFFDTETYRQLYRFFKAEDAKTKETDREKAKNSKSMAAKIGMANAGTIYDFDALGFDAIYADEAHNYRNIFPNVPDKSSGVFAYQFTQNVNNIAQKMFFFCHYVQSKYGRNVVLATATPFQKAVLDIFGMLSLVGLDVMQNYNIYNLKEFCDLFVNTSYEYVATIANEIVMKEVVKSFHNASTLRNIIQSLIYYREKKHFTNVKLPCKISLPLINYAGADGIVKRLPIERQITTYLKMSRSQAENQLVINDTFKSGRDNMKPWNAGAAKAKMLKAVGWGRQNTFSSFFYSKETPNNYIEFITESPKIHTACLVVKQLRKKYGENMPGQIFYSNYGEAYFGYIKEFLVNDCGLKEREVAFIHSKVSNGSKQNIQDGFNEGKIKVIIGTASISEGLNLQEKSTDIHVLSSEWNPTLLVQLSGRIHRQGNPHGYVRFIIYLMQDSIDIPMFQKCEEKISRLNELLQRNGDPVIGSDQIDAEEIKYGLITDTSKLTDLDMEQAQKAYAKEIMKRKMELPLVDSAILSINDYKTHRETMIRSIRRFTETSKYSDMLNMKADDDWTKERKAKLKAFQDNLNYIDAKVVSNEIDQMQGVELLELCKMVHTALKQGKDYLLDKAFRIYTTAVSNGYYPWNWEEHFFYNDFKNANIAIIKCEKLTLTPRGFDRNSDLEAVKAAIQKEIHDMEDYFNQYFKSTDGKINKYSRAYQEIYNKVANIKSKMSVNGQPAPLVAANIGKLDYLLDYTIENRPCSGYCCIPDVEDGIPAGDMELMIAELGKVMNIDGSYDGDNDAINGIIMSQVEPYLGKLDDYEFDERYKKAKDDGILL